MSGDESLELLVTRQINLEIERELKKVAQKWLKRSEKLRRQGLGIITKYTIVRNPSKTTLIIDAEPSSLTLEREKKELLARIRPRR